MFRRPSLALGASLWCPAIVAVFAILCCCTADLLLMFLALTYMQSERSQNCHWVVKKSSIALWTKRGTTRRAMI